MVGYPLKPARGCLGPSPWVHNWMSRDSVIIHRKIRLFMAPFYCFGVKKIWSFTAALDWVYWAYVPVSMHTPPIESSFFRSSSPLCITVFILLGDSFFKNWLLSTLPFEFTGMFSGLISKYIWKRKLLSKPLARVCFTGVKSSQDCAFYSLKSSKVIHANKFTFW